MALSILVIVFCLDTTKLLCFDDLLNAIRRMLAKCCLTGENTMLSTPFRMKEGR